MARRDPALVALALLALLAFCGLAIAVGLNPPAPWEMSLIIAAEQPPGLGRDLVLAVNTLGNLPVWAVVVAVIAVIVGARRGLVAAAAVALSFASDLAAFAVKLIVARERPDTAAVEQFVGPDSFAFPSGHVVRAVALVAIVVWIFAPAGTRLGLALAAALAAGLVMGFARVSLGVHWPTDALGGLLLGICWFAVSALWLGRRARATRQ